MYMHGAPESICSQHFYAIFMRHFRNKISAHRGLRGVIDDVWGRPANQRPLIRSRGALPATNWRQRLGHVTGGLTNRREGWSMAWDYRWNILTRDRSAKMASRLRMLLLFPVDFTLFRLTPEINEPTATTGMVP